MTLLIDHYDSFTYNVAQAIEATGETCAVVRYDEIDLAGIEALKPDRIVFSPGPGRPEDTGVTLEAIREFAGRVPMLGICLGHQAIALAFGARVTRAARPRHGKISSVAHEGEGVFAGLASPVAVARYHSLAIDPASMPDSLAITCSAEDGSIMGIRHREHMIEGLQFHPESVATEAGAAMIGRFLARRAG